MSEPPAEPAYLLPAEVAALLRLSTKSVYRLAATPECPALRIGGSLRFPRARLLRWLASREQGKGRAVREALPAGRSAAPARAEGGAG